MKAYRNILAVLLAIVISFSFPCISFALDDTAVQEIEAKTVEERAEEILSSMTLEEKVAQMFMVYMPSKKATAIQKKYQFGGYLLFANNFKNNSYKKKQSQIKAYQKASKVNAAVATFVFGQILDRTDFKAVDKSLVDTAGRQIFFEQSVNTQKMLLALVTIVPAIGFLLTIIPMFFNNYTGKVKEQAQKELEKKREKLMSDTEN